MKRKTHEIKEALSWKTLNPLPCFHTSPLVSRDVDPLQITVIKRRWLHDSSKIKLNFLISFSAQLERTGGPVKYPKKEKKRIR